MRSLLIIAATALLAGCVGAPQAPRPVSRSVVEVHGLERVMGRNVEQLVGLFGQPAQDFREEGARKLQFAGAPCILDTYLYPARGGAAYVVTHVDARNAAGEEVDRAACVEALATR